MKKEKFKPVDPNLLYQVKGLSVEDPDCNQAHRLIRAKRNRGKGGYYILDYSIACGTIGNIDVLGGDFFNNVENRNQDKSKKAKAEDKYDFFVKSNFYLHYNKKRNQAEIDKFNNRSQEELLESDEPFVKNNFFSHYKNHLVSYEYRPTLTFRFHLDRQFNRIGTNILATTGKVKKRMDYWHANRSLNDAHQPDPNLNIWLSFMQKETNNSFLMEDNDINYPKLIEDSNTVIQRAGLIYCMDNGINGLVSVKKENVPESAGIKPTKLYMSISEMTELDIHPDAGKLFLFPNYENPVSLINGAFLHYALTRKQYEEKNIFSPKQTAFIAAVAGGRTVTRKNPKFAYKPELDDFEINTEELTANARERAEALRAYNGRGPQNIRVA